MTWWENVNSRGLTYAHIVFSFLFHANTHIFFCEVPDAHVDHISEMGDLLGPEGVLCCVWAQMSTYSRF